MALSVIQAESINLGDTFASNDVKPASVFDAFKDIVED